MRAKRKPENNSKRNAKRLSQRFLALMNPIREFLIVLDGELRVLRANPALWQTFRVSAQRTAGRTFFELRTGASNALQLPQLPERVFDRDERIEGSHLDDEFPPARRRHVLLNARQIHTDNAGTFLLALYDATEQTETRNPLEARAARCRAIVQEQTQLICRFRPDASLTFESNSLCRCLGRRPNELFGYNLDQFVPDAGDRQAVASGGPGSKVHAADGSREGFWHQWITRELFDDQGRIFGQRPAVLRMTIAELEHMRPRSPDALAVRLREIGDQIGRMAKDIHHTSRQLHWAVLDEVGFTVALKSECLAFTDQFGVAVAFVSGCLEVRLPENVSCTSTRWTRQAYGISASTPLSEPGARVEVRIPLRRRCT